MADNKFFIADNKSFIIENGVLEKYKGRSADVVIPDSVTSIGNWAFSHCSSLTSVTIPDSVTSIGYEAFEDCSSLTSVTIPGSVKSIGMGAFSGCKSLTSVAIPDSVTSIEDYAFSECSGLTSIIVEENNAKYSSKDGILLNKEGTELICWPGGKKENVVIPSSVTSIRTGAFSGCSNLTSVTIPDSVKSIGKEAFYGCPKIRISVSKALAPSVKKFIEPSDDLIIITPHIAKLPVNYRKYAARGFAEDGAAKDDPRYENHVKYIKANTEKQVDFFVKSPALMDLMCREKLIPAKCAEAYLEAAQKGGDPEIIALMVDYAGKKITAKKRF